MCLEQRRSFAHRRGPVLGYIDTPSRHRCLRISPIRRLPLRPPRLRTIEQHQQSHQPHPLIRAILPLRCIRRRRQFRHLRSHRARPHPVTNSAAWRSTPVLRPDRLRAQTICPRRRFGRSVSRRGRYDLARSASLRRLVSCIRVHDERGCCAEQDQAR